MLTTLCLALLIQDPSPDAAIEAWKKFVSTRTAAAEARKAFDEAAKKEKAERDAFVKAFLAVDPASFKSEEHAEMLDVGLTAVGEQAMKVGDADGAARAFEAIFKLPKSAAADRNRLNYGDVLATLGRTDEAIAQYKKVSDTNRQVFPGAEQRLAVVGKPAADIDSAKWFGADAKPLSAFKGQPVVLDFWATWCAPCRAVMPALNDLYAAHKEDGLVVLGVTKYYNNGYMPADPSQMMTGGKRVDGITEAVFADHVAEFRKNTALDYPFVIGTADDSKNYKVSGIPTIVVVDREGKVAMLLVGSQSEPLVKAAVKRMLADKGENARPAKP